jgi:beta-xylosidase
MATTSVTTEMIVGNPIITDVYTSDPAVLVHDGTAYLYTGHDEAEAGAADYLMRDWLCFSSTDLREWRAHGSPLAMTDFAWAADTGAKAGAVVERDGRFFWYVAVDRPDRPGGAIAVAVADSPTGPFRDARGSALVTDEQPYSTEFDHTIDPAVIVVDGQAHLFWGKQRCFRAPLADSMTELAGPIVEIGAAEVPGFQEGAHVHHRDGWFYLSYGYQFPQRVGYSRSRSVTGPWEFVGILNEVAGNCETNRPCPVEFGGEWFFFYHNGVLPGGGSRRRSVCVDRLHHRPDGLIERVRMTTEGLAVG